MLKFQTYSLLTYFCQIYEIGCVGFLKFGHIYTHVQNNMLTVLLEYTILLAKHFLLWWECSFSHFILQSLGKSFLKNIVF